MNGIPVGMGGKALNVSAAYLWAICTKYQLGGADLRWVRGTVRLTGAYTAWTGIVCASAPLLPLNRHPTSPNPHGMLGTRRAGPHV